jgi:uncharacterized protein YbjT (DUF2867 family)
LFPSALEAAPRNGIVEIAGPEQAPFNEIVARYLKVYHRRRGVVASVEPRIIAWT